MSTALGLWLAVAGLGLFHGLNPAMGWPLAVANGLAARRARAVFGTLLPLAVGHLLAMGAALLPFALLGWYVERARTLQLAAALLVIAFGLYRLAARGHPRALARVPPSRLAWWSFLMATAHGAGLMLAPFALGLCSSGGSMASPTGTLATAAAVAALHSLAMFAAGAAMAWLTWRVLGLRFIRQAWFNLDRAWGASLVVAGVASLVLVGR